MGTTTNNGWTYPESTDLVKDGATAIQTLADDIDTTLGVYAPSSSGLTLINTTTFSAVASQSVNDVFSATYDNYLITGRATMNTGQAALQFRLRASGTDSSASYDRATWFYSFANPAVWNNYVSSTGGGEQPIGGLTNTNSFFHLNVSGANLAATTAFWGGTSSSAHFLSGGMHTLTTQYTGFTIFPSSNNMTGYVSVFGVNK